MQDAGDGRDAKAIRPDLWSPWRFSDSLGGGKPPVPADEEISRKSAHAETHANQEIVESP